MKLYSKIHGDQGQDLIIIHGLFGMSDNWNSLGKKFAKYFKVHLIDLRNHGRSPHSDEFNYDVMCQDLSMYINDHHIVKPIILGHSLGGKVAMKFAFTYYEKMERLIVADIAPRRYSTDFHENLLKKLSGLNLAHLTKRNEVDNALSSLIEDIGIRLFLLKNLYRDDKKNLKWRFNIKVLLDKISNIQDDSFVHGTCNVPTHFIRGENSDYLNSSDEIIIKKHFTDFSITTIHAAGHWLHAENPEQFYQEVIRVTSV